MGDDIRKNATQALCDHLPRHLVCCLVKRLRLDLALK